MTTIWELPFIRETMKPKHPPLLIQVLCSDVHETGLNPAHVLCPSSSHVHIAFLFPILSTPIFPRHQVQKQIPHKGGKIQSTRQGHVSVKTELFTVKYPKLLLF